MRRSYIRMRTWNCRYCNKVEIPGNMRECPGCGHPRDEKVVFQSQGNKAKVLSKNEAAKISKNPDWCCKYCLSLNSDSITECESCGAPRTSENLDYFDLRKKEQEVEEIGQGSYEHQSKTYPSDAYQTETFSSGSEDFCKEDISGLQEIVKHYYEEEQEKSKFKFNFSALKGILFGGGIIALIALFVMFFVWLFSPKEMNLRVQSFSWSRTIAVEEFKTVEESDWTLPVGARLIMAREEVYKTEYEVVGQEYEWQDVEKEVWVGEEEIIVDVIDLGNGYEEVITDTIDIYDTITVQELVLVDVYDWVDYYATKYYYEIDKWVWSRDVKTSSNDKEPYWGELDLKENEKEGSKSETYYIHYTSKDGEDEKLSIDYSDWVKLKTGNFLKVKVIFGRIDEYEIITR